MTHASGTLAAAGVALGLMGACVASDAGYSDVRDLTAARLKADVRWYEHEAASAGKARVDELLSRPLTAESAVQIALLNNQGLQAAFEELGVARSRLVQALRLPNPSVDAALRYPAARSGDPSIDIDAFLDLTDLIVLPLREGVASAGLGAARAEVAGRAIDLAFETRNAFYACQAAQQTLELTRSIAAALRASFEVASSLHAAGNITDLAFFNERALYEESRVAHARAETALAARREALSALLGVWGERARWTLQERLADPTPIEGALDGLEARAIERSLELELGRQRFAAAARSADLTRLSGWLPELRAGVSAEREAGADADWSIGPAVALELPLLYQGQGETGAALAELRREQKLYYDTAVRIRATARAAAAELEAAAKSAAFYRDVLLPLRQRIVDETQLQFNAMSVGAFQLLQSKRDQIETARAYVDVLHDYWRSRAAIDQLLAGRLPRATGASRELMPASAGDGRSVETH